MTRITKVVTTYRKASFWKRLGACLIDSIIIAVVVVSLDLTFQLAHTITQWIDLFLFYGYNILMDYYCEGSVGKMCFNLRVISANSKPLTILSSFYRNFGKVVSSLPLMSGFLRILAPHRRQTIHDELARCYVVEIVGQRRIQDDTTRGNKMFDVITG
jgi:uncharacterized RDD family membrane protein YckC